MQKIQGAPLALAGCLFILATGVARADLKVVQTTTLTNSQYAAMRDSMTAKQRAAAHNAGMDLMMGIPQTNTIYGSGQHVRLDLGSTFVLYDTASKTQTTVNKINKTYKTISLEDTLARPGGFQVILTPSKQHTVIVGHKATAYNVKATSISFPGELVTGQVWSADDIKRPNLPSHGMLAQFSSFLQQVKGLPLAVNLKITGGPTGEVEFRTKVLSVSQAPLPAITFRVPAGYKPASPNAPGNPLMGMGGGF